MIQVFISVHDDSLRKIVIASLNLYREVFDILFVEVQDPYCASMLLVDTINKEFTPNKTILLGFDVQGYICVSNETDHMQILRAIRMVLNENTIEPQSVVIKSQRILVKHISAIETQGRSVIIHAKQEKYTTYHSISYWKKLLWMWPFIEVFRGVLVSADFVESFTPNRVELNDKKTYPISRRNYGPFRQVMKKREEERKEKE